MKRDKIFFFDIDHTIYDPIKRAIPPSTIEAIQKLAARQDTILAIATGRALYMLDIIDDIRQYIDVYITINGQIITEKDTILFDVSMDEPTIHHVERIFKNHDLIYGFIGSEKQGINRLDQDAIQMFDDAQMPLPEVDPLFYEHQTVYQMWAFADETQFNLLQKELNYYQLVPWLSDGFDVVMTNRSKADGVQFILDYFQIPLNKAYCFGDGMNDVEMMTLIPNSIAMGNSREKIKEVSKYITTDYDKDGIKNALIKLNMIK